MKMKPFRDLSSKMDCKMKPARENEVHSAFSPSAMERNMSCFAALLPPIKTVKKESLAAKEGTLASDVLERALKRGNKVFKNESIPLHIRLDMLDARERLYHIIDKIGFENIFKIICEERVFWSEKIHGSPDFAILYIKNGQKMVYVHDQKYGKGKGVTAVKNMQCMTYLSCICKTHGWEAKQAIIGIYQPRNQDVHEGDIEFYKVDGNAIRNWNSKLNRFEKTALRIVEGRGAKPKEVPGSYCIWCPRRLDCASYTHQGAMEGMLLIDQLDPLPDELAVPARTGEGYQKKLNVKALTDKQIGIFLSNLPILLDLAKQAQAYAAARWYTKKPVEGWKLVAGRRGNRVWKDEAAALKWVEKQKLKGHMTPAKLRTVHQVEQLLGKNAYVPKKLYIQKPASAMLVPVDHKKPALDNKSEALKLLDASDDFEQQAD